MIAAGAVRIDARQPARGRRSMSEAQPQSTRAGRAVERRRDPGAPGADLGLRQDAASSTSPRACRRSGVEIVSTGGTAAALREAGIEVTDVAEFTGQAEILDGRVKTLHPRLHAALLARARRPRAHGDAGARGDRADRPGLRQPLPVRADGRRRTRSTPEVAIENIDIGGPTMIRAAAKNHDGVAVVVKPETYDAVLRRAGGVRRRDLGRRPGTGSPTRRSRQTARYDAAISRWFSTALRGLPRAPRGRLREGARPLLRREPAPARGALRRGRRRAATCSRGVSKLHGTGALLQQRARPRLGAAAWSTTSTSPACVIVKHNNPCGVAVGETRSRPTRRRSPATRCRPSAA